MSGPAQAGHIIAVARDGAHRFSKTPADVIRLLAGLGVEGDAHLGSTVQHLSRVAADPSQPNLRQVHLLHAELFDELAGKGFPGIRPGALGENVTTRGIDLLGLPRGTRLHLGDQAVVEVTGLRNPCRQIEDFRPGLLSTVLDLGPDGALVRKCGIMGVVVTGGKVRAGDVMQVALPFAPHVPLAPV